MASSDNIYIMMRDYLTISTEHQRLMRESEQNMARFHNRLSDVLIEYLRQIPVSSYNRHRDASIFSRQTERNTERTRSYSRERQQVPVQPVSNQQTNNNSGLGYNNYRTHSLPRVHSTSTPLVRTNNDNDINTRTNLENIAPPPIPPPAPPIIPSEAIPPPPPPPTTASSPQSPNETESEHDGSSHSNLSEQILPAQVLVHSPPIRTRRRRIFTRTPFYSNGITNTGNRTTTFISSFDSPVRIRPSRHQIAQSTSILTYSDISGENIQERCPIDLIDFSANDSVIRIIHCGHIFREMNIRQHFRNSPRCPICRFDIRDHYDLLNTPFNANSITNTTISSTIQDALSSTIAGLSDIPTNE